MVQCDPCTLALHQTICSPTLSAAQCPLPSSHELFFLTSISCILFLPQFYILGPNFLFYFLALLEHMPPQLLRKSSWNLGRVHMLIMDVHSDVGFLTCWEGPYHAMLVSKCFECHLSIGDRYFENLHG